MKSLDEVKTIFAIQIADAMYMEPNEVPHDGLFSSYGLESITLVRIVNKLNELFGTTVEIKEILPRQTLMDSAQVFYDHMGGSKA